MSDLPRQIRLAPGDYFMHGQDRRMRQVGLPGNVCCAVIKLDKNFDVARLCRRIAESPIMNWLARAKISRKLPMLFPPLWRISEKPAEIFFEHQNQNGAANEPWQLPEIVASRELDAVRGPGLAFDVMRHADGTSHLFLSWNHTHLDARGLDFLLNHLNADETKTPASKAPNFISPKQLGSGLAGWWPNVKLARSCKKWLDESGADPLFSLLPPGPRPASCKNNYRLIYFTEAATAQIDARCQQFNCGFRRSHFYLASSLRALHTVATQRGNQDGAYLIPVPHDTRKRGANGPIFSNHLSILFYRIEPKFAGSISGILGELSRQMTDQIRDKFPESCMAALDMFKPLPLGFYVNHLGKPTRGKFATLSFSDSGETCAGMKDFMGGKILEVTHLVPAWRPPGLMVVFLRFANRLSAQISWVDDCLTLAEVDGMERDVRKALLEGIAGMKVLLVATNRERSPYPVAPLGALCVAGAARAGGHDVEFLDMGSSRDPQQDLRTALAKKDLQAVAFGIRNLDNCWFFAPRSYFDDVREFADIVREKFSGPLILGGTGFSVSPQGWMRRLNADCGVLGEGERAFQEVLTRLEKGQPLDGIDGVITAQKNSVPIATAPTKPIEQLGELPPPAHDLCHYSRYTRGGGFVGVQTKRGCPFKCSYCIYPQLEGKRYRLRPPEAVVEEVEKVFRESKVRDFFFVDSVFNDPRKHALAVCRELARRKLPVRWNAFCNPVGFDAELARAMAEAGCSGVEFGLDVASDKMLAAMNKPFGQKETRTALQAARDAKLPFANFMLFGGPTETWNDVLDTQNFLKDCAPANAVFATIGIRVFENTLLAETAIQDGQVAVDRDLFEPTYYLSPAMAEDTEVKLDRIARRDSSWQSPVDWRRFVTRFGQKVTVMLNTRPQWKYLRSYGRWMRKQEK